MKNFVFFAICVTVVFVQLSVLGIFFTAQNIPSLILALSVSLTILMGFRKSLKWTILAGAFADAGSAWIFGTGILVLVASSWAVTNFIEVANIKFRRKMFLVYFAGLMMAVKILFDFLGLTLQKWENHWANLNLAAKAFLSWGYFWELLFTVVFSFPIYFVISRSIRFLSGPVGVIGKRINPIR